MARGERRFDVVGILLVLLGIAYAGIAVYVGTNTAWSPHTDYYIQQIVGVTGRYLWMAPAPHGLQAILLADGRYVYATVSPDGLVRRAYALPDMNFVGATVYRGRTYVVSTRGKFVDVYLLDGGVARHYIYHCDLWDLNPLVTQQAVGSPVFYFTASWREHTGLLRVDFADLNAPEARVFYDMPTVAVVRYGNKLYLRGTRGFLLDATVSGRTAVVFRTTIRASPLNADSNGVAIVSGRRAGVVYLSSDSGDGVLLDRIVPISSALTPLGAFVSASSGVYLISGIDANNLHVYYSDVPLSLSGYLRNPTNYEIYGSYASDPAFVRGSFGFPRCPANIAPIDANVTYIIAPREKVGTVVGVLTPFELNAVSTLRLRAVTLHTDFPCYHQ